MELLVVIIIEIVILLSILKKEKITNKETLKKENLEDQSPIKVDVTGNLKGLKKIIVKYTNGEKLVISHDYEHIVKINDITNEIKINLAYWQEEISFNKTEVENYDEIREIFLNKDFK
ncbi:hypothetical protein [Fusobacterium sp. SYSU M8D902]|uniref:hypothetical protein n=1 Tax=Fusobacterium sp. SYSU M8D902 TaxID=3159562 RepID=UPI0032E4CE15